MEILRDEYLDYLTGRAVRRPLFAELFGPLVGLEHEWRAQGAREDEIDLTAFGFDYVRRHDVQVHTGFFGGLEPVTLVETPEYIESRDQYGRRTKRFKASSTGSLPLEYPVEDFASWLEIKPHYQFCEERFAPGWAEAAQRARAEGALIVAHIPGGFDEPRQLLGAERLCTAFYDEPALVHDMLDTIGETAVRVLDRVSRAVTVDLLSVHEDLAGKGGPVVGPRQVERFMAPYYRRVWDMLSARGAQIFQQDSDGYIAPVIPAFLAAGINCSYPMEPAAGMDIVQIRRQYGSALAMLGGIDKHVLRASKAAIRQELEYKLQPMMRQGGVVFGLDHRIPNGTPLEHYRYYVHTARAILGLEAHPAPGWGRMAF